MDKTRFPVAFLSVKDGSFFSDAFQKLALQTTCVGTCVGVEALILLQVILIFDDIEFVFFAWVGPVLMLVSVVAAFILVKISDIEFRRLEILKLVVEVLYILSRCALSLLLLVDLDLDLNSRLLRQSTAIAEPGLLHLHL